MSEDVVEVFIVTGSIFLAFIIDKSDIGPCSHLSLIVFGYLKGGLGGLSANRCEERLPSVLTNGKKTYPPSLLHRSNLTYIHDSMSS